MSAMTQEQFGVKVVAYQQLRAQYKRQLRTGIPVLLLCAVLIGVQAYLAYTTHSWTIWVLAGAGTLLLSLMTCKTVKMYQWWSGIDRVCRYGAQAATFKTQGQVDCAIDQFNAAVIDYNQIGP